MDSTTETNFALEPFFPLWSIVLVGILLLALSFWMAMRDRGFAARPGLIWLLLLVRFAAVLILIWMLAGPTLVTTLRKYKRKSIALLVDRSASMGLVEFPDGSGNVSRWAASPGNESIDGRIPRLDSAVATLAAAQHQLVQFQKVPDSTKDSTAARGLFSESVDGIGKGIDLVKTSSRILPGTSEKFGSALMNAAQTVESGCFQTLREKATEFRLGKSLAALERQDWLPDQLEKLAIAVATIQRLADETVKSSENAIATPSSQVAAESQRSRRDKVHAFLSTAEQSWLKEMSAKVTVRRFEFGDKVHPVAPHESDKRAGASQDEPALSVSTDLGAALREIALINGAEPLAAAVLITDGGHNTGRDPRETAPALANTVLHIVPIGNTKMERDVILHHTDAPKAVLQNDVVVVESVVTAFGCANEKLEVQLLEKDQVLEKQTLNVTSDTFDTRIQMRWKAPTLGKHTLTMRVIPVADERTEENNSATVDILVMEQTMRVLVADNYPRWETRYLLNLFKRDKRLVFDQLLFEPQPVAGEGVRSDFPTTLEEWAKYRIVIIGDVLPSQLGPDTQKLLHDYVSEAGGNLILVAGQDAMPAAYANETFGPLIPVQQAVESPPASGPFYLHVADESADNLAIQIAANPASSEQIWHEMSQRLPIYSLSPFSKPKPTTHSLIWASQTKSAFDPSDPSARSFLAWHYVGAGRVVYLAAPLTYQLRYRQGDTYHYRFWGQLLRWIVARDLAEGSQTVRLSTDKLRYEVGEPIQVMAHLRQLDGKPVGGAILHIETSQGDHIVNDVVVKEDTSRPGTYRAQVPEAPTGLIRLHLMGDRVTELLASEGYSRPLETTITVDPNAMVELRNPLCNMPLLREIADASGGMIVPPTGLAAALGQLNLEPETSEIVTKKPLWNRWDLFYIFIGCLTLEWAGRKYLGLS